MYRIALRVASHRTTWMACEIGQLMNHMWQGHVVGGLKYERNIGNRLGDTQSGRSHLQASGSQSIKYGLNLETRMRAYRNEPFRIYVRRRQK